MDYLPGLYRDFKTQFTEVNKAYDELATKCHDWGSLDQKTRHLIKLGIAIGLNSQGGMRSHARQALEMGVTADEIRHTVLQSLTTTGFPQMIAAMKWANEVITKHN